MTKPKVFIGSSVEGLAVAYSIQENLRFATESTVWDQGVFNLSESSLESLINILEESDFGVFVFTPDDYVKIRGKRDLAVRDNVLFELGLFVGKLGRSRAFIVIPDNKSFHLPTDLIGMTPGKYETNRTDKNMQASTGSVSHKIREQIKKLGPFNISNEEPENPDPIEPIKKNETEHLWVALYIEQNYEKASTILLNKIRRSKDINEKIHLKAQLCYIEFKRDPINGNIQYEKLISDNPDNETAYISYAYNLYNHNSYQRALEVVEQGLSKCKRTRDLLNLKADCLWITNRKKNAIEFLEAIPILEQEPGLISKLADFQIESDNKAAVSLLLKKAYLTFPNNESIKSRYARFCYDNNQKEISILLYKELLREHTKNSKYWCLLGNSYFDLEFYNLALTAYEKAAEYSDQKEGWILGNIGNLYLHKQLYNKAEENLRKSLALNDKSDYTHSRLSQLYACRQSEEKKVTELIAKAKALIYTFDQQLIT